MMQKNISLLARLAAAASLSVSSAAFAEETVQDTATAKVIENITIASVQPLNFGLIDPRGTNSLVAITTDNQRSVSGGVQVPPGFFSRATFKVQGAPNMYYFITPPDSQIFVSSEGNSNPALTNVLKVGHFITYSNTLGMQAPQGKLNSTGHDDIYMGGTLIVPPNAAAGTYSGFVPLTVSYE